MDFEQALASCIYAGDLDGVKALGLAEDIVNDILLCNPTAPRRPNGISPPFVRRPTPLVYAVLCDQLSIVKFLVGLNADLSFTSSNKWRPIHYAASVGSSQICEFLLERVPSEKKALTDHGATPLHIAVASGDIPTILTFLNAGADVNHANANGNTPLHISVVHADVTIIKLLLRFGADIKAKNEKNETALDTGKRHGNDIAVQLLRTARQNPAKFQGMAAFPIASKTRKTGGVAAQLDWLQSRVSIVEQLASGK